VVYYMKDINGSEIKGAFYREELNRVQKDKEAYWDVEKVLRKRRRADGTVEYLVKWLGYGPEHNSWVTNIQKKLSLLFKRFRKFCLLIKILYILSLLKLPFFQQIVCNARRR